MNTTSKYVNLNVCSKQTLMHRPLLSTEILMCRNAKEMSEISQVYFRGGRKELMVVVN